VWLTTLRPFKFAKLDEDAKIPDYEIYKVKANSYKTKMTFGLLGYCLQKFLHGKGTMKVIPATGKYAFGMRINKKVELPNELENGEVQWRIGKLPCNISGDIQLSHDKASGYNIITFTNTSKDHMAMREYASIVREFTENRTWLLKEFLEGNFEPSAEVLEDYEVGADYNCDEEVEEEVEAL